MYEFYLTPTGTKFIRKNEQNGITPQKYIDNSCFTVPVIINGMVARVEI